MGNDEIAKATAKHLADECTGMESYEDFVLEQVKAGQAIIGLYPCTNEEHQKRCEEWRENREG